MTSFLKGAGDAAVNPFGHQSVLNILKSKAGNLS